MSKVRAAKKAKDVESARSKHDAEDDAEDDADDKADEGDKEAGLQDIELVAASDVEATEATFFNTGFDPMGLSDGTQLTAADDAALKAVFANDDDDDDDDDSGDKEAALNAILNPQPRQASTGVKSVGSVTGASKKGRTAASELEELSSLWGTKPDVSSAFG